MGRKQPTTKTSPPKKYYFVVEGCTEENYLKRLKQLYPDHRVAEIEDSKGGNAKSVLIKGKKIINKYKQAYLGYVIWFDKDRYFSQDKNLKEELENNESVKIYMSEPCIEHWLLAHFQKINLSENQDCQFYEELIRKKKYIPHYKKNKCPLLERFIDKNKVETAIENYPEIGKIPRTYFT